MSEPFSCPPPVIRSRHPSLHAWLAGRVLAPCLMASVLVLGGMTASWAQGSPSKTRVNDAPSAFAQHGPALAFARSLDQREGWDDAWAQRWVGTAEFNPQVVRLMTPAPSGMPRNWTVYRNRFIEPRRIQAGLQFWREHDRWLQQAEAEFGVPAWLIVGIIGVETLYGQHMGSFRVLDALTTLAFHFPPEHPRAQARAAFFTSELEALLRKSRAAGVPPTQWRGSFAGAIGLPQFMPSNWPLYGVDFDRDSRVDLSNSAADAIGSVARYMQAFGWQTGLPTHFPVHMQATDEALHTLLAPSIRPTFAPAALHELGARLEPGALAHEGMLALVELPNGDPARGGQPTQFVAGTSNFYAITRYNQSSFYALAVIELGQAVEAQWKQ